MRPTPNVSNVADAEYRTSHGGHDGKSLSAIVQRIGHVIRGKEEIIRLAMIGFLARGHLLLEDVPGVGKTTLARAMARALGGVFHRIQFTADMLPADIVGGQVLDRQTGQASFRKGPIFANVVLADELNRATPRTQSGLLEAMSERAISIDGVTYALPEPFLVIATQNPTEHAGVYDLPQSQLDRFLIRTDLGYPADVIERELLMGKWETEEGGSSSARVESIEAMLPSESIPSLFAAVDAVFLSEAIAAYIQNIARATRASKFLRTGVSTRGALLFGRAARARAMMFGRRFVTPDDIAHLAIPICAHRVLPREHGGQRRENAESILKEIVASVPVPV